MTLKNPYLFKSLTKPDQILGMHLIASLLSLSLCFMIGILTELMWGFVLAFLGQSVIGKLTRQDPYFLEVWIIKVLNLRKTKRVKQGVLTNRYAV